MLDFIDGLAPIFFMRDTPVSKLPTGRFVGMIAESLEVSLQKLTVD